MRLEFEPNASVVPFVEKESGSQNNESADAGKMFREGVKAAQEGNRAEARNLLLRVTENDSENENAWLWLASISEYPEELSVFLNNVLRINPHNERALEWQTSTKSLLAKTLVQRGIDAAHEDRKAFARQCFEQAVEHEAENEMAWLWMASIADSEAEKVEYFEKVLSVNPENETAQNSLKAIQDQKTQKLFDEALAAAFDGKHAAAQEMLEGVLSRNADLEDAWVLKSHLAGSFEERAECFLKLCALNPENEMAKANLASWRMLADQLAAQPKAERTPETQEFVAATPNENLTPEETGEVLQEDFSPNNFVAETPAEEQFAELSQPENLYLAQTEEFKNENSVPENFFAAETAHFENQEAETNFDADVQPAENDNLENRNEFSEAAENSAAEFETDEILTESAEDQSPTAELILPQTDLTVESQAEESKMDWAFTETAEASETGNHFADLGEFEEIHYTQQPNFQETETVNPETENLLPAMTVEAAKWKNNEAHSEEWKNTSPDAFFNFSPAPIENSFVSQIVEPLNKVADLNAEEPPMAAENESQFAESAEEVSQETVQEEISMPSQEFSTPPPSPRETVLCPFCNTENDRQAFSCAACQTVLTLSDMEMLLGQQNADAEKVKKAVESFESENESYGLNAEQMMNLGIGHLNLKNNRQGFLYLQEAVQLNPNNVILDAQVNALAIRLAEIEQQQSIHDTMPKNRRILVVDDSPTVRKLISGKLEKCGHEVICAVDGLDALEKMNTLLPDLILLDITMPRMDGYQVCKMIRTNEMTREIPVVMISGKDGFFDKVRGKMAGTTGYITKPFGPETLMKTVETYLN